MIPKIIHYCWFGKKELPEMAQKCLASWKHYCPDFEIMEWNEDTFDISYCPYSKEAYSAQKYAFVSDVARLYALYSFGGIYMDTDVELIKSPEELLTYKAVSGFESYDRIPTGLMASEKGNTFVKELLDEYNTAHFIKDNGEYDKTTNVTRITNTCTKYGLKLNNTLQTVNGFTLLPYEYLCPKNVETNELNITENTICIHHFDGSWMNEEDKIAAKVFARARKYLPITIAGYYSKFYGCVKVKGIKGTVSLIFQWIKNRVAYQK